jgi:hypothetical protein
LNPETESVEGRIEDGDYISLKVVGLCPLLSMFDSGSAAVFTGRGVFLCGM